VSNTLHHIVVVGSLPPPVTGQSKNLALIAEDVADRLGADRCAVANISSDEIQRSANGSALKLMRLVRALTLLTVRRLRGRGTLYMVAEGNLGLPINLMVTALARGLGYRIVLQHRTFSYIDVPKRLMALLNWMMGPEALHVFLSEGMAEQYYARYSPRRPHMVNHNLAQTNNFFAEVNATPPTPRDPDQLVVGYLSNLMRAKGIDTIVEIARLCAARQINVRFIVAGGAAGPEEQALMDAACAELPVSRMDWRGPLHGSEKFAFYRGIDVFVFPTRYHLEAQPNVVLEAQAAGAYVVASDFGVIREDLAAGGGNLVPRTEVQNAKYWCDVIEQLAADRNQLIKQRGKRQALTKKRIVAARQGYEELLTSLTGTPTEDEPRS